MRQVQRLGWTLQVLRSILPDCEQLDGKVVAVHVVVRVGFVNHFENLLDALVRFRVFVPGDGNAPEVYPRSIPSLGLWDRTLARLCCGPAFDASRFA